MNQNKPLMSQNTKIFFCDTYYRIDHCTKDTFHKFIFNLPLLQVNQPIEIPDQSQLSLIKHSIFVGENPCKIANVNHFKIIFVIIFLKSC